MEGPWTRRLAVLVALATITAPCARWANLPLGTTKRQLVVAGVTRTYLLRAGGEGRPGRALVLVLHGLGGTGAAIERRTRGTFDRLADRDGAVIVYPDSLGEPHRWNDGWPVGPPGASQPDDIGFLSALVGSVVAELGVDRKRVFAAGLSNGAGMVYRIACERPDLVAAVAAVAGGMAPAVAIACPHGTPVSIIAMHGTEDSVVPLDRGIRQDIATWVKRDGCTGSPTSSQLPDVDPLDRTRTRVDVVGSCNSDTEVAFYTIEGGGHAWPGGNEPLQSALRPGHAPNDFDAGVLIWDFFQKHPRAVIEMRRPP